MISTIARAEAKSLLRTAPTWVLLAVLSALFAYLFLHALETYLTIQPQLALQDHPPGLTGFLSERYMATLCTVIALAAPLLAMRSFSDEYRQNTLALWQSSPVTSTALVLGKFLGVCFVLSLIVLLGTSFVLLMRLFVPTDMGVWWCALLGLLLLSASFTAIGLYFSTLTQHALLAALCSLLCIAFLWLIGSSNVGQFSLQALAAFALPNHLGDFFQGQLLLRNVGYFMVLIGLFLGLSIIRLDSLRLNQS